MEPMHWEYVGALGGVIGIGWLVVVPMYRGWTQLNEKMSVRVKKSIRMLAECDGRPPIATTISDTMRAAHPCQAASMAADRSAGGPRP